MSCILGLQMGHSGDGCVLASTLCKYVSFVMQMLFVSCVHPVAVLNAAFCMTCSLLMLVEDARGDHIEEANSRAGLITAL